MEHAEIADGVRITRAARAAPLPGGIEHEVVDHELPAALEKILERQLAARAFEQIILFDFDHRQPAPFGIDAVVGSGEAFFLRENLLWFAEPTLAPTNR